jgi:hypothetical protein
MAGGFAVPGLAYVDERGRSIPVQGHQLAAQFGIARGLCAQFFQQLQGPS